MFLPHLLCNNMSMNALFELLTKSELEMELGALLLEDADKTTVIERQRARILALEAALSDVLKAHDMEVINGYVVHWPEGGRCWLVFSDRERDKALDSVYDLMQKGTE